MRYFNKMTTKNTKIIDETVITNNDNNQFLTNKNMNNTNTNDTDDINNSDDIYNINNINNINNIKNTSKNTKKNKVLQKGKTKITVYDSNTINNSENINIVENINTINQISCVNNGEIFEKNNNIVNFICKTEKYTERHTEEHIEKYTEEHIEEHTELPKKSNNFLKELLLKQLPNINPSKKLTYNDIRRISKFLGTSIFSKNNCSIWNGYITNEKNQTKGTYINFYFNQKKIALHRLLYLNFIGDILNTEYIKFSCANKGKCCNIHHMKKYSYNSTLDPVNVEEHHVDNSVHIVQNKNDLVIEL